MTLTAQDWQKLRTPILGLGSAFVIAGLLVSFAGQYRDKNEQALQNQQNQLNQARQKLELSGMEKQTIIEYLPLYNQLLANGFIGEEHRIEWVEALRNIHSEHKLFSIDYEIGLQENYKPTFLPSLGSFVLHRSVMKLNLDMLHEGDLLNLLDGLNKQGTPFIVRDCEMKRAIAAQVDTKNLVPNLKAHCEVDWLTLRDPQLSGAL